MERTWGIVELMGHNKIAGIVSEEEIAGTKMLRIDVPEIEGIEGYTKYYGSSSVYAITPTDEQTARLAVKAFQVVPISPWILRVEQPALSDGGNGDEEDYGPDYDYREQDDWSEF